MGDKITIAEARARRTDPVWRRRQLRTDLTGLALVALLLVLPPVLGLLFPPLGVALGLLLLLAGPAALWWRGPVVGLERRSALLVAVPLLNLYVLGAAAWRVAHLGIQRWQGPLEPRWDDRVWWVAGVAGAAFWLATLASLGRALM